MKIPNKELDTYGLPQGPFIYASVAAALLAIRLEFRSVGKTVIIVDAGNAVEYWWESGVGDEDLVPKVRSGSSAGNLQSITDGVGNNITDNALVVNGFNGISLGSPNFGLESGLVMLSFAGTSVILNVGTEDSKIVLGDNHMEFYLDDPDRRMIAVSPSQVDFITPVSGMPAINSNDYMTKEQVETAIADAIAAFAATLNN